MSANDEALRLDPFRSRTLETRAWLLIYSGRPGESLDVAARVVDLDGDTNRADALWCVAYMHLKRDRDAVRPCETASASWNYWILYAITTAAYANLGEMEKATTWKKKLMESNPRMSIAQFMGTGASTHPEFVANWEHTVTGWRKVGIPEQ